MRCVERRNQRAKINERAEAVGPDRECHRAERADRRDPHDDADDAKNTAPPCRSHWRFSPALPSARWQTRQYRDQDTCSRSPRASALKNESV